MKTTGRTFIAALAVWALLSFSMAQGQVRPTQSGRVLDASPSLGSRYNTEVSSGQNFNSQLYVTGQVTGLGYFHGSKGSSSFNQLQSRVPSASLGSSGSSTFGSRSVGLTEALAGQTYRPSPYYSRSQTVLGPDSILTGKTVAGSNVPLAPTAPIPSASSFGRELYVDAMADFRLSEANRGARVMVPEQPLTLPRARTAVEARGPISFRPWVGQPMSTRETVLVGDLFGVRQGRQQDDLARELFLQAHPEQRIQREAMRDQGVDTNRQLNGELPNRLPLGQRPSDVAPEVRRIDANAITTGGLSGRIPGVPERNQDVFMDMLVTLRQVRQDRQVQARVAAGLPVPKSIALPTQPKPLPGALVENLGDGGMVIHSLAGQSKDMFNARMSMASQQLKANQYYEAAYSYETAGLHDQRNPLAKLGRGLSLLGAGESLTAAYEIEGAMKMFPPLAQTRVDLSSIMGAEAIGKQLTKLDQRMERATPEARQKLQFLATFLHYNSRQYDQAKTYAQKLVSEIQKDSLLRTYAQQVLDQTGGKEEKPEPDKEPAPETPAEGLGTGE